ncbi:hypothetical protein MAPG_04600 [Magnaporthiopsis poae ATCC 64411]|uniref:Uncharacterized protein n=1 Tax=Magnaporthiopsis poae (strain ATCC 64411 / 73-15) TaxID=644358 RepID=A0A0C4DX62_MAGP6|nr:hypothetical protein MAPG_04600 [Magnaporthiopsis poae ATCC 64411]
MQFNIGLILASLAAVAVAFPAGNSLAAEETLEARQGCRLDEFRGVLVPVGVTTKCVWEVCTNENTWRVVRDCGLGSRCDANPTTCRAKDGTPFLVST